MGPLTGTGSLLLCLEERETVTQVEETRCQAAPVAPHTQTRVPSLVWPWTQSTFRLPVAGCA